MSDAEIKVVELRANEIIKEKRALQVEINKHGEEKKTLFAALKKSKDDLLKQERTTMARNGYLTNAQLATQRKIKALDDEMASIKQRARELTNA